MLIIKKKISDVRDSLRKILIVLFKHFKIKATVSLSIDLNNNLIICSFINCIKNEFDGFIKTIQVLEKEIKTKNQASTFLTEKVFKILLF